MKRGESTDFTAARHAETIAGSLLLTEYQSAHVVIE
jgi:hypothetical protein